MPQSVTPKKQAFLKAFIECGQITMAASAAEIHRKTHYHWLKEDPEYAAMFEESKKIAAETLESEAVRRAYSGVDEPVWYQGEQCGTVRKYSDTLMIFLLKGIIPDKYRERSEHTLQGPDGGPASFIIQGAGEAPWLPQPATQKAESKSDSPESEK